MLGIFLVVIGVIFLMKNLGIWPDIQWDIIWPVIIIAIGLLMVFKKK